MTLAEKQYDAAQSAASVIY